MSKSPADPVEEPVVNEEEGDESDEYEDIEVRQDLRHALYWSSADVVFGQDEEDGTGEEDEDEDEPEGTTVRDQLLHLSRTRSQSRMHRPPTASPASRPS